MEYKQQKYSNHIDSHQKVSLEQFRRCILSKIRKALWNYLKRADLLLWLIMLTISAYSLLLLKTIPPPQGSRSYFTVQLISILIGYAGAIVLTVIDYRSLAKTWYFIGGISLILLLYTLFLGEAVTGDAGVNARAWIKLPGGLTFQTSELIKIGFMITFAKHLSIVKEKNKITSPLHILLLSIHCMIPVILIHLQGDDGAAAVFICMFLVMMFVAGVQLRYFAALFGSLIVILPLAWQYILADYQKTRIINMFQPESDPLGAGLQQIQGRISIGSGEWLGRGLFTAPRVQRNAVPVQESDFIFTVAAEQLGFIGAIAILVLIILLLLRTMNTARKSCDDLGTYMCFGFFAMITFQSIINLGMCLSLLPVMGVTLPFFSAGGSSAACLYLGFGLVQNVYMHKSEKDRIHLSSSHFFMRRI